MQFVRLDTSDNVTRWINLNQISRVTVGTEESGTEVLVAIFADGDVSDSLRILGTDDLNRESIRRFERALNHHCETE